MKIPRSIRAIYDEQRQINELLQQRVDELFNGAKRPEWFYRGRVKELESFAQKLETGRVRDPREMEDFFACTLAVENRASIQEAVDLVERHCVVISRRPPLPGVTHKRPESFMFDDLRLYVKLRAGEMTPESPLEKTTFEVQVKTFLQHAWSIATHDLVYKGENIHWGRARIAFQIKAMLEHAEASIEKADEVAASEALALVDEETRRLKDILDWVERTWDVAMLPKDKIRLSTTISDLLQALNIELGDLSAAVAADTALGRGTVSLNLSPYGVAVQALATHQADAFTAFLRRAKIRRNARVLLVPELELDRSLIDSAHPERVVVAS